MTTKSTTEKPAKKLPSIRNYRELRRKMDISQFAFWSRIGVTQSGGSRYEKTGNLPKPIQILISIVHGDRPIEALAEIKGVSVADLIADHVPANKE